MNVFYKCYCKIFQTIFKWVQPILPYREPEILKDNVAVVDKLKDNQIKNLFFVTDKGVRELKLHTNLTNLLRENNINVIIFDDIISNPTIDNIENAVKVYNEKKCQGIIAFGGGSVIDTAKMVGARVNNPERTVQKMKGLLKIKNPLPIIVAIPTTAGTGSECTLTAVITDNETHQKYTINDFKLIPQYALLDESLTIGLPKFLTATTGMDALTHAIEAYIGKSTTAYTRQCAKESIRLIIENLTKAYEDGSNERARKHLIKASYLAGVAFSRSYVGYVHAIAHTLGGKYNTPHGLANAVILPYVLGEYGKTITIKLSELARYTNIARPYDSHEIAASKFINKIIEMNEYMNLPKKFDFIVEEDIHSLAKLASKEANPLYPVPKLMDAKELSKLYYLIKE